MQYAFENRTVDRKEVAMKPFVLGLVAALGFSSTASADCLDVATRAIEQKGFAVQKAPRLDEVWGAQGVTGYRAWFRVARYERGHIVVNMRTNCSITHIWGDVPETQQALRDHD
jgi:hypothetical protein